MSLSDWRTNGWLQDHAPSKAEIADKLAVVDRSLLDAGIPGVSADARSGFIHTAVLALAAVALAAEGFRVPGRDGGHERLLESLRHTIRIDGTLVDRFQRLRRLRNTMSYERIGVISDATVQEFLQEVTALRTRVHSWLVEHHPALL